MKQILSLILLITLYQGTIFAQSSSQEINKPTLEGKVIDLSGEPIPFANIALYLSVDSSLVKGVATDMNGQFKLSSKPGNYYLQITFLSYQAKTIGNLQLGRDGAQLGNIALQPNSKLLDEVEVTAERSQMELKLDKRIFNIDKDLSNAGANAAEILDNIPSVQVDVEGNVSLRGSQNVRVLIDGKPSTIVAGNIGDALRQFQGNMIERVEVITNPSARYDAEGEAGIINIVLKKDKRKGLNGSVDAVVGSPANYRAAYNLNYRQKKVNLFTSVGVNYRRSPGGGETFQSFNSPDTSYLYTIDNDRSRGGISANFRLGSDIFLNDKNTLTVAGFYQTSDEENISELTYKDLFADGRLFQEVFREDIEEEAGENLETSINYTKTFDKKDQKFTIDLQWSERNDLEESDILQTNFRNGEVLEQLSSNLEANRTYLIQSDYIKPIGKDGLFETGMRTTLRTVDNEFQVQESLDGSPFEILPQFNNDFLYQENIYAAYVMFGEQKEKFSYQLGLRTEYSDISTELKVTNERNSWEYLNAFPSANFTFKLNGEDDLQLSYSRRINRPRFRELLPFSNFSDNRNIRGGNIELQPEYTDSYELGYLKYFKKGSLFSSIYYRYRTGVIDRITTTNEDGITVRIPVNLAIEHNVGYEVTGTYNFSKKIALNTNLNIFRSDSRGTYEDLVLENTAFNLSGRMMLRASELYKKIDGQLAFNYRAPRQTNQGEVKSLYTIDLSFSKDILKGNGTVVASVRDLLNSRVYRSVVDDGFLYRESDFQWRIRQFLLTFTYRINKKKERGGRGGGEFEGGDDF